MDVTHWKNLKALTVNPLEENKSFSASSLTEELAQKPHAEKCYLIRLGVRTKLSATFVLIQFKEGSVTWGGVIRSCVMWCKHLNMRWQKSYGMLERCSVADGGKMLLKFLDPGFLKRWREEPEKSRVSACSSCPAPPRGSCTTGCLDNVTRITLPWRRCPFRWLIAVGGKSFLKNRLCHNTSALQSFRFIM